MASDLLEQTVNSLRLNKFNVYTVESPKEARDTILRTILPEIGPGLVSYGDSLTLQATGVLDDLRSMAGSHGWEFLETFERGLAPEGILERRRRALQADIFFTGTNALTSKGQLVNLDMIGNRVGGIVWGPRRVILTIGTNKIVEGLDQAMARVRLIAAPQNAQRIGASTPCAQTGECMDCNSPHRICNVWSITEKSWPAGRISVVLIKGEYGL
ncbi:lactate utilization protein [Desulfohalobium retbaense]|uniref:LUD domain-containing protein n=1 Tax=Desulfohalobium retbaense (strain ATCC 49708 / DSM 5692 / JCM 16813 / HR100) TaxID=485915 RepID=C8X1E9_DESRD|nr:lactate utilization protein [Desulfohalobium retbaense]ACV68246.1 protein of unknown function DUF1121 [Desulfohalobium retbaense DSM 5692]